MPETIIRTDAPECPRCHAQSFLLMHERAPKSNADVFYLVCRTCCHETAPVRDCNDLLTLVAWTTAEEAALWPTRPVTSE